MAECHFLALEITRGEYSEQGPCCLPRPSPRDAEVDSTPPEGANVAAARGRKPALAAPSFMSTTCSGSDFNGEEGQGDKTAQYVKIHPTQLAPITVTTHLTMS